MAFTLRGVTYAKKINLVDVWRIKIRIPKFHVCREQHLYQFNVFVWLYKKRNKIDVWSR